MNVRTEYINGKGLFLVCLHNGKKRYIKFQDNVNTIKADIIYNKSGEIAQGGNGSGSDVEDFVDLSDAPSSYSGEGGNFVKVNSGEDGLEFDSIPGGGDMLASTYDPDSVNSDAFDMDNMVEGDTTKIMTGTERTKLTGIEDNATADQTGAQIKSAYEAEADTNAFTDTEKSKLSGIESNATADQTGAEIKAAYEGELDTNAFTDDEQTKLSGIASGAEVNVNADWDSVAGDSQILNKPTIPADHSDLNDDEATKHRLINDSSTGTTELWSASKINTELGSKSDSGHDHDGTYEPIDATIIKEADVDDTPVNGVTTAPVSSNWAYDHANAANPHSVDKAAVGLGDVPNLDTTDAVGNEHTHANKATLDTYSQTEADLSDAVSKKHDESHSIASHSDTTATGAELDELTDGSETTLHSHAGGSSVYELVKCKGNLSSASFNDTENALSWNSPVIGSGSSNVSVLGSEITINVTGTYKFTVTLRTDSGNRTELFIRTYINTGGGLTQDTDEIVSDYVSRDADQDTGSVTLITALELDENDVVEFRGFGDTDGTCVGLDAGTILLIERVT